jgi:hypothetical protein
MLRRFWIGSSLKSIGSMLWIVLLASIGCHCSRRIPVPRPSTADASVARADMASGGDVVASEATPASAPDASIVEASGGEVAAVGDVAKYLVIPNPNMAEVCMWSGTTESVVDGICPGREGDWEWITEMVMYKSLPGESVLSPCPLANDSDLAGLITPGWLMRVEETLPSTPVEHTTDHYYSRVLATRLDGPIQCAVKLVWNLKQQRVNLAIGTVVRYLHRYTILNAETDAFTTNLLRDEKGELLIGYVAGIRPQVWAKDMWPEVTLSFASTPICQKAGYPDALALRLTLSSSRDTCTLDSGTARCCSFDGVLYEVEAEAWHTVSGGYPDYAQILVARRDLLIPAP